jgi:ketosteroid isomerase-like protein
VTLHTGDRVELADLVSRYALYVDLRDLDELAGLFTADAVFVLPDPPKEFEPVLAHSGREGIVRALSSLDGIPVTFHAVVGQVFDAGPEPGTATGHIACAAHHLIEREPGKPTDLVWHLRYADVYRREDDAWRIARRALHLDWTETRPVRRWRGGAQ